MSKSKPVQRRNREKSLLARLSEITTERKASWILWKHGLSYKGDSFEVFSNKVLNNASEEATDKYIYDEDVQQAIRYLMKILHNEKMIELYNIYYEKAKEDTQAFKAFVDFSKQFFEEENEKENELTSLLNNINIGDINDQRV